MYRSEFSFMLKPSPLGGIGVFAVYDIPAGTELFNRNFEIRTLKVKDVPPQLLKYCIYTENDECLCPERFDRMEIGWYLNHSSTPNIGKKTGVCGSEAVQNLKERAAYALREIKAGEELLIDYNDLDEPEHLKEDYYKRT